MSWLGWVLIALGGAVAFFIFTYFIGNPKFWRLVKDHPDEAYGLFLLSGCLVNKKPDKGTRSGYTGLSCSAHQMGRPTLSISPQTRSTTSKSR
jgi:hypothetical protein